MNSFSSPAWKRGTIRGSPSSMMPAFSSIAAMKMNSGTAEQEQNGVPTPSNAAATLPPNSRLPASSRRARAAEKYDRSTPTAKTTAARSRNTFGTSIAKNSIAAYRKSVAAKPGVFESNLNLGLMLANQSRFTEAEKAMHLLPEVVQPAEGSAQASHAGHC